MAKTMVSLTASMRFRVSSKLCALKSTSSIGCRSLRPTSSSSIVPAWTRSSKLEEATSGVSRKLELSHRHTWWRAEARSAGLSGSGSVVIKVPPALFETTSYASPSMTAPVAVTAAQSRVATAHRSPSCTRPMVPTHSTRCDCRAMRRPLNCRPYMPADTRPRIHCSGPTSATISIRAIDLHRSSHSSDGTSANASASFASEHTSARSRLGDRRVVRLICEEAKLIAFARSICVCAADMIRLRPSSTNCSNTPSIALWSWGQHTSTTCCAVALMTRSLP